MQTLSGDIPEFGGVLQPAALERLFERLAGQTGQMLNISAASRTVGIEGRTADNYARLLSNVFLIRRLPAWGRTTRARAGKTPKLHIVDSGLAAHMLTELGHLLETFVVGELLKQASWHDDVAAVAHWHTHDNKEVDCIIETHDGQAIGFEVKARGQATAKDIIGLRLLRDLLGDQFKAGFVLTTGPHSGRLDDRIYTCPIDRLWTVNR